MADKHLTELEWKKFARGRDLKDAALLKAFAALERAKSPGPDEAAALAELEKQADLIRKAAKADKAVGAYLDDMDETLKKRLIAAKSWAQNQAKAAKQAENDEEGEEDEGPKALTKGLASLLKQVENGTPLRAMIVTDGKACALMLSRRAIAPAKSKELKDYLGLTAAKPPLLGECIFEAKAITFVLQQPAAGLAKKLKVAILAQTDLKRKVRVRGDNPDEVEEVEDEVDEQADAEQQDQARRSTSAPSEIPVMTGESDSAKATSSGSPRAASFVQLQGARLAWERTRKQLQSDIDGLIQTIRQAVQAHNQDEEAETEVEEGEFESGLKQLDGILKTLDTRLIDSLDLALNAEGQARLDLQVKARAIVVEYQDFVARSSLMQVIDANPFQTVSVRKLAEATLAVLAKSL